jgi:N-acetylmuramate 1-kinase
MPDVELLKQWVLKELKQHPCVLVDSLELRPLAGDAGFRRYYHLNTQPALLVVTAPKRSGVSESAEYFSSLSSIFRHQGVSTPAVLSCDATNNRMLIECFVGGDLYDALSIDNVDALYGEALMTLLRLQQIPRVQVMSILEYDHARLLAEMELFPQWFVCELLDYSLSPQERDEIDQAFHFLLQQALSQPQVLVHRDYHSRNLIHREGKALGVIDFQDAVWGPISYDVVSLLKDCYIRWEPEQVRKWALGYGNMAYELGLMPMISTEQFLTWFDTMGLQRHIKVLGIFARLSLRDGKHRYLHDLPLVIRYVLETAQQYSQTQWFAQWFEKRLLPICEKQSWYQHYLTAGDRP